MEVVALAALKYQSLPQNLSPPEMEHSPPPPPPSPHVYSISKLGCIFHFDLSLFDFIAIRSQHFYSPTLSYTPILLGRKSLTCLINDFSQVKGIFLLRS